MPHPAFNPLVERLSPPPIPSVQAWARHYDGGLGPLIDLSQAVPGYSPHPALLGWLAEAAGSAAYAGYGAIEGDAVLRKAYAAEVAALYGGAVSARNIHLTAGCNQAFVATVMAVAAPGETVLMTNPCYFNHETTLAMMGIKAGFVECRADAGFVPRLDDISAALDRGAKALALVSPNNPTGAVYPSDLLRGVFDLCRARGVWLILDETYRDFLPGEARQPHGLFEAEGWDDTLIQLYSFSKSFCIPGHRLGAITAGDEVVEQVAKVMDNLQICAPRAPQQAVARALAELSAWRDGNRAEIARRADAMRAAIGSAPGWTMDAIGAYFAFVRHPFEHQTSTQVAERLARDLGLVTIPGSYFGTGLDRHLRIAFANADIDQIAEAGERLREG
jgi:aspartate/methionine/tyrosine aminotransferase